MRLFCLLMISVVSPAQQTVWTFDSLETIGGLKVKIDGDPRLIDASEAAPGAKAIEFDGVDDALFFDEHPLAGADRFTFEVIFRPASGGAHEQRFFHLQELGAETRLLFETRLVEGGWYLDAFAHSGDSKALMARDKIHPLDRWYHIAMVYDGEEYRSYVDGDMQTSARLKLAPQGAGRSSVGVRITLVDYYKGAIHKARFTQEALDPSEFLRLLRSQ